VRSIGGVGGRQHGCGDRVERHGRTTLAEVADINRLISGRFGGISGEINNFVGLAVRSLQFEDSFSRIAGYVAGQAGEAQLFWLKKGCGNN